MTYISTKTTLCPGPEGSWAAVDISCTIYSSFKTVVVRFDVFTAVTMKNVLFCDIETQFVLHRRHITFPLRSPAG
jgi:hypothetical protein